LTLARSLNAQPPPRTISSFCGLTWVCVVPARRGCRSRNNRSIKISKKGLCKAKATGRGGRRGKPRPSTIPQGAGASSKLSRVIKYTRACGGGGRGCRTALLDNINIIYRDCYYIRRYYRRVTTTTSRGMWCLLRHAGALALAWRCGPVRVYVRVYARVCWCRRIFTLHAYTYIGLGCGTKLGWDNKMCIPSRDTSPHQDSSARAHSPQQHTAAGTAAPSHHRDGEHSPTARRPHSTGLCSLPKEGPRPGSGRHTHTHTTNRSSRAHRHRRGRALRAIYSPCECETQQPRFPRCATVPHRGVSCRACCDHGRSIFSVACEDAPRMRLDTAEGTGHGGTNPSARG